MHGPKNPSTSLEQHTHCYQRYPCMDFMNKLMINDDKTEFSFITKPHLISHVKDFQRKIGGKDIPATDCAKNLGVIFDQTLSIDKQINSVSRVNLFHLRNVCRLLSDDASSLVIHYLVTARLDYCNILYNGLNSSSRTMLGFGDNHSK